MSSFGRFTSGLFLGLVSQVHAIGCIDESGNSVDWWFLLKHPRWADHSQSHCIGDCQGSAYVWVSSASSSAWQTGIAPVTSTSSLLGKQLQGIYDGSVPNYVFYNDQLPDGSWSETYGHSKGFFGYDSDSAFWVQHSIPKFPNNVDGGYKYLQGELWYGQHAFCMTLSRDSLDEAAKVMSYAYPQVYDHALPDSSLQNVAAVVAGKHAADGKIATTVEAGFAQLTLLGKTSAANIDMMDSLIAPTLQVDLVGQSWLNSGGPIGGYCPVSGYKVFDELMLTLTSADTHETYVDHSKWAVAQATTENWWCALDNNHVASQETRSGLAVCLQLPAVASILRTSVEKTGPCGAPSPPHGACCYFSDDQCAAGQTCCSSSGKSYQSESSCKQYGSKHGCVWRDGKCAVPEVRASHVAQANLSSHAQMVNMHKW